MTDEELLKAAANARRNAHEAPRNLFRHADACVRLSRSGLSDHQIGDMIGMSPAMVSRYTRHSRQQDNAVAAVYRLEGTSGERSLKKDASDSVLSL